MTRINLCSPSELTDQHLIAEYRELPRIFTMVLSAQMRGETPKTYGIPESFKLGSGHMKFFADKLNYLECRYHLLVCECERRKFKVQHKSIRKEQLEMLDRHWFNSYNPELCDIFASYDRLDQKIAEKPSFYTKIGMKIYIDCPCTH